MSIEGISTSRVESTPNYSPIQGPAALSNYGQGKQEQSGSTSQNTRQSTSSEDSLNLSAEAQAQVRELQQRDREVRSHEQAHIAAGGQYVRGGINYTYTRGPDNKQYATGGSVSLDTSSIAGDPEATLEKARVLRSAALAPANPSAQDQSVASAAAQMESKAQTEKTQEQNEGKSTEQNNFAASFAGINGVNNATQTMPKGSLNNATFTSTEAIVAQSNTLLSLSVPSKQNNINAAHEAYKTQQRSAFISSSLAPWGTGISLQA